MQAKPLKTLTIALTTSIFSACVSVPNTTHCAVMDVVQNGMHCTETETQKSFDLDASHMIEFLEPQAERPDPDHPGKTLPARAGATCMSEEDRVKEKTAMQEACRELGSRCSYEFQQAIARLK